MFCIHFYADNDEKRKINHLHIDIAIILIGNTMMPASATLISDTFNLESTFALIGEACWCGYGGSVGRAHRGYFVLSEISRANWLKGITSIYPLYAVLTIVLSGHVYPL